MCAMNIWQACIRGATTITGNHPASEATKEENAASEATKEENEISVSSSISGAQGMLKNFSLISSHFSSDYYFYVWAFDVFFF